MNNVENQVITVGRLKHFKETYLDPAIDGFKNSGGTQWYQHEIVLSYVHNYTDEMTGEDMSNTGEFSLTFMSLLDQPVSSLQEILLDKYCFLINAISPETYDGGLREIGEGLFVVGTQKLIRPFELMGYIKLDFAYGTPWDTVSFEIDGISNSVTGVYMETNYNSYYTIAQRIRDNVTKL